MSKNSRRNPFVGLRPFESSDSLYYFGRNEQVKTLLRQLYRHRFVAVVGSLGSGKSSLVRAGLIPQLEAGFLVQDRDQWRVARLKPGDAPLGNLAEALLAVAPSFSPSPTLPARRRESEASTDFLPAPPCGGRSGMGDRPPTWTRAREQGVQAALDLLRPLLDGSDTNLFILVDQFEELFRFGLNRVRRSNGRRLRNLSRCCWR
ncbi:MAG: hypothetical protein R3E95_13455 [Thiolinea sp.]